MAKKATNTAVIGSVSKVWDERFAGKGEQHTIYAPALFFELWPGDNSALKAHVNEFLVAQDIQRDGKRVTPGATAKIVAEIKAQKGVNPADIEYSFSGAVTDDDI